MNQIDSTTIPGAAGRLTSRVGLGLATLMREGSRTRRQRIFDTAYEAGIRHFDVAPLYGLGIAENELGRLLPRTMGDITVATKFGLLPSPGTRIVAKVQRPLRQLLARSDRLRTMARSYSKPAVAVEAPKIADVRASLRRSLRLLGLEHIDILLLHDMAWAPEVEDLCGELSGSGALPEVGVLGVTGDAAILNQYPESFLADVKVLQLPGSSTIPSVSRRGGALIINYGLLSTSLSQLDSWLDENSQSQKKLEEIVGQELRTIESRASLLASLSLSQDNSSILLLGSTQPSHIQSLCTGVSRIHPTLLENRSLVESLLRNSENGRFKYDA
ncbi:aldo/keto reductase [Arthrobacter sp. 754]|uniref:aldo/keto reductase n=1 Tax=Arthrobacter sp. 754 TaxID=3156315 RepID=UPI003397BEFC